MDPVRTPARWLALLGVAGLVVWRASGVSLGAATLWSALCLAIFTAAVFFTIFLLAPEGWRRIERHPDLLVPLGLLLGALGLVEWLSARGFGLATPLWTLSLGSVAIAVTLSLVLQVLLHVLFATWTTLLVVEAVWLDRANLTATLARSRHRYLRVLVIICLGWTVNTVLIAVEFAALMAVMMGIGRGLGVLAAAILWILLLAVLALHYAINLATAALLPVAVESDRGFVATLCHGIAESWRNRRKWWKLVAVQYVLLGAWALVRYASTQGRLPSGSRSNVSLNFSYFAPWVGGYRFESPWYARAIGWLGHEPLAFIVTLSAVVGGLLAIAVQATIVQRLGCPPSVALTPDTTPPDRALAETEWNVRQSGPEGDYPNEAAPSSGR